MNTLNLRNIDEVTDLEKALLGSDLVTRNLNTTIEEDIINNLIRGDFNKVVLSKADFNELVSSLGGKVNYAPMIQDQSLIYMHGPRSVVFVGME